MHNILIHMIALDIDHIESLTSHSHKITFFLKNALWINDIKKVTAHLKMLFIVIKYKCNWDLHHMTSEDLKKSDHGWMLGCLYGIFAIFGEWSFKWIER